MQYNGTCAPARAYPLRTGQSIPTCMTLMNVPTEGRLSIPHRLMWTPSCNHPYNYGIYEIYNHYIVSY